MKGMIDMASTPMTTAEVATEFKTDTRTLRKFLRSPQGRDGRVGKGSRWSIERRELASLRKRFNAWTAEKPAPAAPEAPVEVDDAVLTLDALDGPTDEEIAEL
jgi:hypothetical protein